MTIEEAIPYLSKLHGWCLPSKMKRMHELVLQTSTQFNNILSVEIGLYAGRSFFPMALAHKELQKGYAFGFDSWDNIAPLEGESNSPANSDWWATTDMTLIWNAFMVSASYLQLKDYARWAQCKSEQAVRLFEDDSITLLSQDGNHASEVIVRELELWSPKMKVGGLWVADDLNWREAIKGYERLSDFGFEEIENHTDWGIFKKVK